MIFSTIFLMYIKVYLYTHFFLWNKNKTIHTEIKLFSILLTLLNKIFSFFIFFYFMLRHRLSGNKGSNMTFISSLVNFVSESVKSSLEKAFIEEIKTIDKGSWVTDVCSITYSSDEDKAKFLNLETNKKFALCYAVALRDPNNIREVASFLFNNNLYPIQAVAKRNCRSHNQLLAKVSIDLLDLLKNT